MPASKMRRFRANSISTLSSGQPDPDAGVGVEFLGGAADQLAALDDYLSGAAAEPAGEKDN